MKKELHRGAIAKPPRILSVRVLVREDLARLKGEKRVMPRVKAFRDTHHRLARLCAAGTRIEEILRITGYSAQRLTTLKMDPAFQQLIAEYRGKVTEAFVESQDEFYETATSNMLRMERQVEEHLDKADEDGDLIPLQTLFKGIGDRADRFGYSKKTQTMASQGRGAVIDAKADLAPQALASPPQVSAPIPEGPKSAAASAGFRRRM